MLYVGAQRLLNPVVQEGKGLLYCRRQWRFAGLGDLLKVRLVIAHIHLDILWVFNRLNALELEISDHCF